MNRITTIEVRPTRVLKPQADPGRSDKPRAGFLISGVMSKRA